MEGRNIPDYWIRPAQRLLATAGLHRFVWDVRYAPPAVDRGTYDIAAVEGGTPRSPQGMFVLPGTYQVRLTVDGRSFRQPIVVRMDPRVRTSLPDLTLQFKLSRAVDEALRRLAAARVDLEARASKTAGPESETLRTRAAALQAAYAPLPALFEALQEADLRPNPAVEAAVTEALARVEKVLAPSLPGSHRP